MDHEVCHCLLYNVIQYHNSWLREQLKISMHTYYMADIDKQVKEDGTHRL